jgi:hypothetical protein
MADAAASSNLLDSTIPLSSCRNCCSDFVAWRVVIVDPTGVRSVRLVAATRATATATVAAAVSTTPRWVATGRATVTTAHGRTTESAAEATATARAAATTTSAAVHAGEVGALGDDLRANCQFPISLIPPFGYAQHTLRFLLLNTLSLRTSACVTKLGSENST